jgi:hypothetical protein
MNAFFGRGMWLCFERLDGRIAGMWLGSGGLDMANKGLGDAASCFMSDVFGISHPCSRIDEVNEYAMSPKCDDEPS